jgi:hypothetical protein
MLDTVASKVSNCDTIPDHLEKMDDKLSTMEEKLNEALEDNKLLKKELAEKTKTIEDLKVTVNKLQAGQNKTDQYMRSWSTRILNIPITDREERCPFAMKKLVYELAFLPILTGAYEKGTIPYIPTDDQLLEVAHVLPGKSGTSRPIIARFKDRNFRTACLRYRKDFATRTPHHTGSSSGGGPAENGPVGRGSYAYPFYEDLTPATFAKLKELTRDSRVQSCWTVNGQIRFKLSDSSEIKKVVSVFDPIDYILA